MPMEPFYSVLPDLAMKETRVVHLRGRDDLPDGEFGFVELYCNEANCDCRRAIINVMDPATGPKVWATINYGWESLEFYEGWMRDKELAKEVAGAALDPLNAQTPYSRAFLKLFQWVLEDELYVERLKRHYAQFKEAVEQRRGKVKAQRSLHKKHPRKRKRR